MDHGEARPQPCPGPEAWHEGALTPSSSLAADERLDLEDGRWEDVHVITGALKLFFRELPEPLFPFSHFRQFIAAISEWGGGGRRGAAGLPGAGPPHSGGSLHPFPSPSPPFPSPELQDQAQRSRLVRSLVHTLPAPNHDTMRLLFQHLCR